jgi:spermidine synthase
MGARPGTFWTVEASVRAGGLATRPYRVTGRYAGFAAGPDRGGGGEREREDWGFHLAGPGPAPQPMLAAEGPVPRSLGDRELREGARAAADARLPGMTPSTLIHPRYWEGA